jgi:outer membrane lipoprotein carrier protein
MRLKYIFAGSAFLYMLSAFGISALADDISAQDELQQTLSNLNHLSANFKQTVIDGEDIVYEATGKLFLAKPGKVRWETEFPDEALMIADGTSIWNIDSFVEQITVLDQAKSVENNPIVLLTSEDSSAWDDFSITKLKDLDKLGFSGVTHGYAIQSLQESPQIQMLSLYFNGDEIIGMSTLDAQGQLSQLAFKDVETKSALNASLFEVKVPDNYTVDDQR